MSTFSVQVGGNVTSVYNRESNNYARISLATSFLEVPSSKVDKIYDQFSGFWLNFDGDAGLGLDQGTLNCSLIDSMPAITINIGNGFESIYYTVPAREFVVREVSFLKIVR